MGSGQHLFVSAVVRVEYLLWNEVRTHQRLDTAFDIEEVPAFGVRA